jgi:hypothetical protein
MRSRAASALRVTMIITAGAVAALLAVGCSSGSSSSGGGGGGGGGRGGGGSSKPAAEGMSAVRAVTLASQRAASVNAFASTMKVQMSGSIPGTLAGTMRVRKQPSVLASADFSTVKINGQAVPGGMQEILTSRTLYLKLAALQRQFGKPWGALPLSELSRSTGINLSQFTQQMQESNPMTDAQMLTGAKNLRAVGSQTIDGVATTHYTGSFAASAGLAKLPPSLRGTEQRALQALGISTIGFNAWIDAQHRIRKIVVAERGRSEQITSVMQVTAFDQAVKVTLPPASQVKTIPASALRG